MNFFLDGLALSSAGEMVQQPLIVRALNVGAAVKVLGFLFRIVSVAAGLAMIVLAIVRWRGYVSGHEVQDIPWACFGLGMALLYGAMRWFPKKSSANEKERH